MTTATSRDGTTIAFDTSGEGPPLVVVGGALNDRHAAATLAGLLAPSFTVYTRTTAAAAATAATRRRTRSNACWRRMSEMHSFRHARRRQVSTSKPVVAPPADIGRRGTIRFCTSFDSPPQEFLDEDKNPAGSNVDIGIAVADLMGVDAEWRSSGFATIIGTLQAKQCDAINSSLSYTDERDQVVDYALYGLFTDVIIVEGGNRQDIQVVDDLSGKELGWVAGYATEGLEEIEQNLGGKRLEPLKRVAFSTEADALGALRVGGVDAVTLANVQGDFYVSKQPGSFEVVRGIQVFTRKFGFGVREGEKDLQTALSQAIDALYEDGIMCEILRKWNMTSTADPDRPCKPG
jgi:polar amino acid transport system substrate-binding protein